MKARPQRGEQQVALQERVDCLEKLLGDTAEKHAHWEEMHVEQARLQKQQEEQQCEHHSSLQERMDYMEKLLGDSADKHAQTELQRQASKLRKDLEGRSEHHVTMEQTFGVSREGGSAILPRSIRNGRSCTAKKRSSKSSKRNSKASIIHHLCRSE